MAKVQTRTLNQTAKKILCRSERSEESLFDLSASKTGTERFFASLRMTRHFFHNL
jgi:hypothetical protein